MQRYSKIQTIYQRDKETFEVTPLIRQEDTVLALAYLKDIIVEEKIDGTNAQIEIWFNSLVCKEPKINFYSRNNLIEEKDVMFIRETIEKTVNLALIKGWYYENYCLDKDGHKKEEAIALKIFGEVFGDKIQKNIYTPKDIRDFRVFDIQIGNLWLSPESRDEICIELGLKSVPIIGTLVQFPPYEIVYDMLHRTHNSSIIAQEYGKDSILEGYILRPQISLSTNKGRVIGKIKVKDFRSKKENREIDRGRNK